MLKVLKQIVQDVTTSAHLREALEKLVSCVRSALSIDSVSVYLIDAKYSEYVLIAIAGSEDRPKGQYRVMRDMGLMGWVGQREEPLNVANIQEHPAHQPGYLLSDHLFRAFLGVPIIQHRKLYGVLVAQKKEPVCFDDSEEAFFVTLTAQLGGLIAHADLTGELAALTKLSQPLKKTQEGLTQVTLNGIGCVPGVAIGRAVLVYPAADIDAVPRELTSAVEDEVIIFHEALQVAREYMHRLSRRMKATLPDSEYALFEVYLHILDQDNLGQEVQEAIRTQHLKAHSALAYVIRHHVAHFNDMKDPYLRERANDLKDIGRRVLAALQSTQNTEKSYPKRTILMGDEITAAALAEVPEGQLAGVVSAKGASNSHVAILARALGVPTVMGVRGLTLDQLSKRAVIVDGYDGHVFISPSKILLTEYKQLEQEEDELNQHLVTLRDKPAETQDHYRLSLQVNTGLAMDAGLAMSVGAEGVGLYRSEIPFMSREQFPSEDEQYVIYRQVLKAFAPRKVSMRTLDIGGDKCLSYFPIEEDNPYLGWRGIRITLDHPDVFLMQVRAMMRANQDLNNLRILLPMVTTLQEVDEALNLIDRAYHELRSEHVMIEKPELGVMVEVPALVYQARSLAKRVHFLSIGSNDLTQYMLAVDRNNARVSGLYDALHPAVLQTLLKVVEGGHAAGVEVGICGEMASDPYAVILLLAMGFDVLSMNSASLPRVKWMIRSFSMANARKLLAEVMTFEHASEIRLYMQRILEREGLGGLIRAGKS